MAARCHAARARRWAAPASINGMIYNRGQRMDYDTGRRWAIGAGAMPTCCPISSAARAASARATTPIAGATAACRSRPCPTAPALRRVHQGRGEVGIPHNPDYNGAKQEGHQLCAAHMCKGRRRVSTARAYLHPAKSRSNLTVITNAFATKILLEGKKGRRHSPIPKAARAVQRRRCGRNGGDPVRRRHQLAATAATLRDRPGRAVGGDWASRSSTSWPASARTCAITTRRASSSASRMPRP